MRALARVDVGKTEVRTVDSGWKRVGKDPVPQADLSNLCDEIDAACARRDQATSTMAMINHAINDAEI